MHRRESVGNFEQQMFEKRLPKFKSGFPPVQE
ncbi:pilS cassette [Neisseria mucosa]|nr:pilS cassette [Neisseria mucosa]